MAFLMERVNLFLVQMISLQSEYEGREIYYLLLGYELGREYRHFALILNEVEDQAFRRVGIV